MTNVEKQLGNILDLAAQNEVVQKRNENTSSIKMQREAYYETTSLQVFPLQDLAMEYLDEMLKEYIGGTITTTHSRQPLHHGDDNDRVKMSIAYVGMGIRRIHHCAREGKHTKAT